MTTSDSRVSLQDVAAIAREVVRTGDYDVIGTIPGGSDYVELILARADAGSSIERLSIGVHRTESAECIREGIARHVRTRVA